MPWLSAGSCRKGLDTRQAVPLNANLTHSKRRAYKSKLSSGTVARSEACHCHLSCITPVLGMQSTDESQAGRTLCLSCSAAVQPRNGRPLFTHSCLAVLAPPQSKDTHVPTQHFPFKYASQSTDKTHPRACTYCDSNPKGAWGCQALPAGQQVFLLSCTLSRTSGRCMQQASTVLSSCSSFKPRANAI